MTWQRISFVTIGLFSMACAAATPSRRPLQGGGHDVITAAELTGSNFTHAYQAVIHLGPEFLHRTTRSGAFAFPYTVVSVYGEDLFYGNSESLRAIPMDRI